MVNKKKRARLATIQLFERLHDRLVDLGFTKKDFGQDIEYALHLDNYKMVVGTECSGGDFVGSKVNFTLTAALRSETENGGFLWVTGRTLDEHDTNEVIFAAVVSLLRFSRSYDEAVTLVRVCKDKAREKDQSWGQIDA